MTKEEVVKTLVEYYGLKLSTAQAIAPMIKFRIHDETYVIHKTEDGNYETEKEA